MESSVGSIGDFCDNALAESVVGLYKTEVIRREGPWQCLDDVEFATLDWVGWYNDKRLLEPIEDIPPAEFEQMYYQSQRSGLVEARLNKNGLRKTRSGSEDRLSLLWRAERPADSVDLSLGR
jgi:hypothetical protein